MRSIDIYIYDFGKTPPRFPIPPPKLEGMEYPKEQDFRGLIPLGQVAPKTKFQVGKLDPLLLEP